jgi:hypothetical protein
MKLRLRNLFSWTVIRTSPALHSPQRAGLATFTIQLCGTINSPI